MVIACSIYSLLFPVAIVVLGPYFYSSRWGTWVSIVGGLALLVVRLRYFGMSKWSLWLYYLRFSSLRVLWRKLPSGAPKLYLLATDLLTGRMGEFSPHGFRLSPDPVSRAGKREQNHSLSLAVNASAAFPPLFPPQVVSRDGELAVLTDGGVFDNLGVCDWQETGGPHRNALCLVSDAGCEFVDERGGLAFSFVVLRNARSSDISMNRLAEKDVQLHPDIRQISIRSTDRSTPFLPDAVRAYIPRIRTDLNRFTRREAVALIVHGMDVAESVNEVDLGQLTDADRDAIHMALNKALAILWRTPHLEVSHSNLERSNHRSFRRLWLVWLLCTASALYGLHILGELPMLGLGVAYNAWYRCPAFHEVVDRSKNADFTQNELYKQAFAEHARDQRNVIYQSNTFAGPTSRSNIVLSYERDGLSEDELTVGDDFFAILIPESEQFPDRVWLPCKVLNQSEVVISVPRFRGFGRILLSAHTSQPISLKPKSYQEVP